MKKRDLIEHDILKGFYQHPDIKDLYVSEKGEIYDDRKKTIIDSKIWGGYRKIRRDFTDYSVHQLVCETFLEKPLYIHPDKLICNHKNGIKIDNRLENLEWCDYIYNINHAFMTGLRTDNIPVLVKDLRNNKVMRFYSIYECGRFFKVNGGKICRYIKPENYGRVYLEHFVFIKEGQEFPNINLEDYYEQNNGVRHKVVIYDPASKNYYITDNVREASIAINYSNADKLSKLLRITLLKDCKNSWVEINGYELCYLLNFATEIPEYMIKKTTNKIPWKPQPSKPTPIKVENLRTKEIKFYNSCQELADELGINRKTLQRHIWRNNGLWYNILKISYLSDKSS